jgi:hypothetical protein
MFSASAQTVTADGEEVHYSKAKITETKFETSWTMAGGHIIKLKAYSTPPALHSKPGFRQFDLQLDGCSYFEMPHIYELGTSEAVKLAVGMSKSLSKYSLPPSTSPADSEPNEKTSFALAPREVSPLSVSTRSIDLFDVETGDLMDQQVQQKNLAYGDEYAMQPSFESVSNQIMGQYPQAQCQTNPQNLGQLAIANESHTYYTPQQHTPQYAHSNQHGYQVQQTAQPVYANQGQYYQQPQHQQASAPQGQQNYYTPQQSQPHYYAQQPASTTYQPVYGADAAVVTPDSSMSEMSVAMDLTVCEQRPILTMQPLSLEELEASRQPGLSEMERAMNSLVNLDDITEAIPAPEQIKLVQQKSQNLPNRSKPLPPATPSWNVGGNAKLGEIKEHAQPKAPSKEVMRTHAFDPAAAQAGMMVPYGSSIPQAGGFGFHMQQTAYYNHRPMYTSS